MTSHRMRETPAQPITAEALVLALHALHGIGDSTIQSVRRGLAIHRMQPSEVPLLSAAHLEERFGLSPKHAAIVAGDLGKALPGAVELLRRLRGCGISVLTADDAAYPQALLRTMERPPAVLYGAGSLTVLDLPMAAVLTSNGASQEARRAASDAINIAIERGCIPVTGHNRREYQEIALAARRRDVPTCYVLDRGVMTVPGVVHGEGLFAAARIWRRSDSAAADLVVSPFHPTMSAVPGSNRRRDEIVAGLAQVILVTYIREGGTMHRVVAQSAASGTPVVWTGPAPIPDFLTAHVTAAMVPEELAASSLWNDAIVSAGRNHT